MAEAKPLVLAQLNPLVTTELKTGDRIWPQEDFAAIPVGTEGTVLRVHEHGDWSQVEVALTVEHRC